MRTLARKAANFRGLADPPGSTCSLSFEHTELASTRSGSPGLEQGAQGWSGQPADSGLEQGAQGWKGSLPADSSLERGAQGWKGSLQTAAWSGEPRAGRGAGLERRPAEGPHHATQGGVRQQGRCALLCYGGLQTLSSWEYCEVMGQGRSPVLPGGQSLFEVRPITSVGKMHCSL